MLPLEVTKKTEIANFHPYAPAIKYVQHDNNTCCLSSLAYAPYDARDHVAEQAISLRLESFLFC